MNLETIIADVEAQHPDKVWLVRKHETKGYLANIVDHNKPPARTFEVATLTGFTNPGRGDTPAEALAAALSRINSRKD